MAVMIPSDIERFGTPGEEVFYRFLESCAKPDSRYIAWYTPSINDSEPDFLLYSPDIGLVIFEVKDWVIDQIEEADKNQFTILNGSRLEKKENPYQQARRYFQAIMDKIKHDGHLLSKIPEHVGKSKVPVSLGVVFPNIHRDDFEEHGFGKVIDPDRIFFEGDLSVYSPICEDLSGSEFTKAVTRMYPPLFPVALTPAEVNHLRQLIFPTVRIDLPVRGPSKEYQGHASVVAMLDHQQEILARKFDGGHRIISGPSGSGKTLILAGKAQFMRRYNPAIKRVLFVCFNITLAHYIRRLLAQKHVPMGPAGVEVCHFFELCAKIAGETVHYEKEEPDYYDMVVQLALEKLPETGLRYDAILIDEGQDFSDDMYRVVAGLLNPATDNLTVAIDPTQGIYPGKGVGIVKKGKVHHITRVYRNTREITAFVAAFMGEERTEKKVDEGGGLFPALFESHGPRPSIKGLSSEARMIEYVADTVESLVRNDGFPSSEIAILYTSKTLKTGKGEINLPEELMAALDARGILSTWASEDYRAKKSYDITTDSVTISTIHSAKGLDYACVFLAGLDFLSEKMPEETMKNLTYVGLTRARYHLFIPHVRKTQLVERLLRAMQVERVKLS